MNKIKSMARTTERDPSKWNALLMIGIILLSFGLLCTIHALIPASLQTLFVDIVVLTILAFAVVVSVLEREFIAPVVLAAIGILAAVSGSYMLGAIVCSGVVALTGITLATVAFLKGRD